MIASSEGGWKELLGSIQLAVKITRSMSLEYIELTNLRPLFPFGGVSLSILIFYTRSSFRAIQSA